MPLGPPSPKHRRLRAESTLEEENEVQDDAQGLGQGQSDSETKNGRVGFASHARKDSEAESESAEESEASDFVRDVEIVENPAEASNSKRASSKDVENRQKDAELDKPSRSDKRTSFYGEYFDLGHIKQRNRMWKCKRCGVSGYNSTFARPHFRTCYAAQQAAISRWNEVFPSEPIESGQTSIVAHLKPISRPTMLGFEECLARLVVRRNLPFVAVDWPELRDTLECAFSLGKRAASGDMLRIPYRRQFVDRCLLGDDGFVR